MRRRFRSKVSVLGGIAGTAAILAFGPPLLGRTADDAVASNVPAVSRVDTVGISTALARALTGVRPTYLRNDEWLTVRRLYGWTGASRVTPALWLDGERMAPRASELVAAIDSVESVGLRPAEYGVSTLRVALQAAASARGNTAAATLANADLLLTSSFVSLVDDLLTGRVDPREVEPTWHIAPRAFDVGARTAAAVDSVRAGQPVRDVLAGLRPDYGSYGALVQALARYRAFERAGGWPAMPNGPVLRPGDEGQGVAALRHRLTAEGYLSSAAGSDTLDATLAAALAEFQRRHGLSVDSAVGPRTRAALDVPADRRVRQIEGNLERLRWLPPVPGERFIVVNIPAFILYAYDGDKRVLDMSVVVGDELIRRRTPIFADTVEYIEFGPYWNVPRSIAVNEILPQARRDRGYLARNRYQILRGWGDNAPVVNPRSLADADLFSTRYRVRQLPGPDNALGRVKFMFPNDYAVYLHDTPAKTLFDDAHRAHSHGCVRVADPEALAKFLLQGRDDWPPDRIQATLAKAPHLRVTLRSGPPVYLVYLTAFGRAGQVLFRDDIYDRDDRLLRALARRS